MANSKQLADRIRAVIGDRPNASERMMFGGVAFLLNGNMSVGVVNDLLCARLGKQGVEAALRRPHTRPMDFTGKPLSTMVYVEPEGVRTAAALQAWVGEVLDCAATLPAKVPPSKRLRPKA